MNPPAILPARTLDERDFRIIELLKLRTKVQNETRELLLIAEAIHNEIMRLNDIPNTPKRPSTHPVIPYD